MLKPQEIFILLALSRRDDDAEWTFERLASELEMPPSQVFKSLERASDAQLFVKERRRVIRRNLLEFLVHGARYAFAARPGALARGIAAGWQAPGLSSLVIEEQGETYIWRDPAGTERGQSVEPLHPSVPSVALRDPELHALFALADIIRVGTARERKVAASELERRLG